MTKIDAAVKTYKQGLKDSDATLKTLEDEARELTDRLDAAHDAENLLEDCERGLDNVASEKAMVREAITEASLTEEDRVPELKDQYRELADEERRLQGQREQLTGVIENCRVDHADVARLRAQLRRVDAGGSTLVDAVRKAVQDDTDGLSVRVRAVEDSLPEADDLELLYSLGFTDKANSYRDAIEKNEAIREGSGEQMREILHRDVQRLLARA